MHKTIITAVAAFVMGGVTTGVLVAQAQQAQQTGPAGGPSMAAGERMHHGPRMGHGPGQDGWADRMHEHHAQRMGMMRAFALVHRTEDRDLTPPDVKKIAEAFLLWNGNHSWQVLNVAPAADVIGFDVATKDGSVIAHFTMDPKTGRLDRVS
jgi:hypothetical protein